jgi:ribonuclease P protein subunit RPR2
MAKKRKENPSIAHKLIYSRASYLYQAANYLARKNVCGTQDRGLEQQRQATQNTSRQALIDMRAVSRKAQIRQTRALKRSICKFCDTLQIEGETCHSSVENLSKGGRKPWADVLVVRCTTCQNAKRFPVSATQGGPGSAT